MSSRQAPLARRRNHMSMKHIASRAGVLSAFAWVASVPAGAQSVRSYEKENPNFLGATRARAFGPSELSYGGSSQRDTWRTLALVSGIVLIFGLVDDDPTLTILGGVGLLFSLYETGQFGYRYHSPHGTELI